MKGLWVPIVTPFLNDHLDEPSLRQVVETLISGGVSGLVALGTTGECPVLSDDEQLRVVRVVRETAAGRVPVFVGAGGPNTREVVRLAILLERAGAEGLMSVCPYYSRPSQAGIRAHFEAVADATSLPLVLYNIPRRTGINIENDTILRLAERNNIVALKDVCGDLAQSAELLRLKPPGFSVLTGDDALYFVMLALGADGGILASAHEQTGRFVELFDFMKENDHLSAREIWGPLSEWVSILFGEPNPAPLKQLLFERGLVASPEVRLPLMPASDELRQAIKRRLASGS